MNLFEKLIIILKTKQLHTKDRYKFKRVDNFF